MNLLWKQKNIIKKSQTDSAWIGYVGCKTRKIRLITKTFTAWSRSHSSTVQSWTHSSNLFFFPLTKWKEMGSRNKTSCNRMGSAVLKVLRTISGYWSGHTPVTRPTSLYLQTKGKCSSDCDSGGRRSWETWLGGEHVRHPWAWCMMHETNVSTLPVEHSSEHRTAERGTAWS